MKLVKIGVGSTNLEALPGEGGVQKCCGKASVGYNILRKVAEKGRVGGVCLGSLCGKKWSLGQ